MTEGGGGGVFSSPFSAEADEMIGMLGGMTISASLIPQLYKTLRTRRAQDISYWWQATYIVGLSGVDYYALVQGLWPVYVPGLCELGFIVAMTVAKFVFERGQQPVGQHEGTGTAADQLQQLQTGQLPAEENALP